MIQKIKRQLIIFSSVITLLAPVAVSTGVAVACNTNTANQIAAGSSAASGDANTDCANSGAGSQEGIGKLASNVVNIFSFVVGAIAVIMIIYGGFRYITSGGASEGVSTAKNTLIYAIVGLIIVALAQILVHFVLNQTSQAIAS